MTDITPERRAELRHYAEVVRSADYVTRQQRCAEMGHPGTTYNPWSDTTWCACGWAVYPGVGPDAHKHLACCGGPLDIPVTPDGPWEAAGVQPLPGQEPLC